MGYSGLMAGGSEETGVTHLLDRIRDGDGQAGAQLLDVVYNELRGLASAVHGPYRDGNTLQPTALVHEAWIKLVGNMDSLEGRRHFFATAARAMRQVLADRVRDAKRQKRGGGQETIVLNEATAEDVRSGPNSLDLMDLDDRLTKLAGMNERCANVVEMRLLGAMTVQEIADEMALSKRTVEGDWQFAKAWLRSELFSGVGG